jgi:protein O-GlcNAc transferase
MPSYTQLLAMAQQFLARQRFVEAESLYRQVLALRPRNVDALVGLGVIYNATTRHEEAIGLLKQALAIQPYSLLANASLGAACYSTKRYTEALGAFQQFLTFRPKDAAVLQNLGNTLKALDRREEAIDAFRKALDLQPDNPELYYNLANTLKEQRKFDEAIDAYQRALKLRPNFAEAHHNLASSYAAQDRLDEAVESFRMAMTLKPGYEDPISGLANVLRDVGRVEESLVFFRQYLEKRPSDAKLHSSYLLALEYLPELADEELREGYALWAKRHADFPQPTFTNSKDLHRRLRVGYLSADFRRHSVAFFLEKLLAFHDPSQVEVFCYNTNSFSDDLTERFKGYAHQWRDVALMPEQDLAVAIREDQVDILVDISGHTAGNRLLAMARQPAPVQVSYLGYIATSGLPQVGYRLTDAFADPPGMTESQYSERLVRLPSTFACFRPDDSVPDVVPPPAINTGHITFGALSVAAKLNAPLVRTWGRILKRVEGSRLILGGHGLLTNSVQNRLAAILAEEGIARNRIEFFGTQALKEYYDLHARIDILLDPFPIAGHTISCIALWQGVPMVSLAGRRYVSRLGASVLSNLNLTKLLAQSVDEYVEIAVGLAGDLPRLRELRSTMRERMLASPLMDYPTFARKMESAYRSMWCTWCSQAEG